MRPKLLFCLLTVFSIFNSLIAQNSPLKLIVKWKKESYEHKVELYNTANDLLLTLCDPTQCYQTTQAGSTDQYSVKYNLGCVPNGNNYYLKLYDAGNDGWDNGRVRVKIDGTEVVNDTGTSANNTTGQIIYFNVSGGDAKCASAPDLDQDGIEDSLDYDDDGDGIPDSVENLGEDRFECTLPPLNFKNGYYDAGASAGSPVGTVGAIYRFGNTVSGYDVLMEITELTNATVANIDDDTIGNADYLQTTLTFAAIGTPGATFKFTIVNSGTTIPSTNIFRVNGITWDCDGTSTLQESVIYYNPAAYGIENPSDLTINDLGSNNIEMVSDDISVSGFSTLPWLRAYFQFIGNSFTMRMQAHTTTASATTRQFAMSFTQCEFLDFNSNNLTIVSGEDFDNDGVDNHLDLDSDNDGIPDNIEAQLTAGYIAPTGTVATTGIDTAYGTGLDVAFTDFDFFPDFLDLDTDNDGIPDIEENGMANAITTFSDSDNDGLDLLFEGSVIYDPNDPNDDIDNPSDLTILPDTDGDLLSGGDLDYRDLFNTNPPALATIDFDGVDDYLKGDTLLQGLGELTFMAWVKLESTGPSVQTIVGEDVSCRLYVNSDNRLAFGIRTADGTTQVLNGARINYSEWHHVTGTFSSATGTLTIYVDGEVAATSVQPTLIGQTIEADLSLWNGNFEVGRLSRATADIQYFIGNIDEVRVFNRVLTDDQVQQMVYQEIENNSGNVRGTVIPKDIIDNSTQSTVPWSSLIAYYPMTDIKNNTTTDITGNNKTLSLYNILTAQDQTAPMPYVTSNDGNWTSESTWLYGDVWDIEDVASNKDNSIIKISNNVSTSSSHIHKGLIIDSGNTFTVNGDNEIKNSWYLELNGTLDLMDDSQLIQTVNSDLVTSSTGKLLRRQEGAASPYWYNYWSSPVGATGATSLTDNNASTNNTNNSDWSLNMLKDESGIGCLFTSGYTGNGNISTYWLYTFINGRTYWDWTQISTSTGLKPGVGYTQKGTGTAAPEQQYIFEGKPNNGTILLDVADVGGPGSVANVSKTEYLLGNPYASAIDIYEFIDDNAGVIDGYLQLWQQWGGASHNLSEYQGGYAQVNKMGSIRAKQFVSFYGATTGGEVGTKKPTRYLPVGQGFIAEIIADGQVEFNNSQRVFIKESDANGTYNSGSTFSKTKKGKSTKANASKTNDIDDSMQKIRLEFNSVTGPETRRELLLGFSDYTTDAYDYGYDAKETETSNNDLNLELEGQNMNIQAYAAITDEKAVPLNFRSSGDNTFEIRISELENIEEDQAIYLHDNLTGAYFDLRTDTAYGFSSGQGIFNDRFEIVFQSEQQSLSTEESAVTENYIYYKNTINTLYVKKLNSNVSKLSLISMRGQVVLELTDVSREQLENGIQFNNISTGAYVVGMRTEANEVLTKKIIVN